MAAGLLDALRSLTWRDLVLSLVDVLVVYYVIYRVLLLIRGTRATQMLLGLLLVAAAFFAARQLDLVTLSWLLENVTSYIVILVIVVFQQDIRRGLMRIGSNLFSFASRQEETEAFEEIVRAIEELARLRQGAILVLEREASLAEFARAGVALDARVSKELLLALFLPAGENPLHDGAALIKAPRIQRAGVVLPLTESPALPQELGTRHRAAIGITEETDAVAIVVSEERGEVSLAFRGQIARGLDPIALRRALWGLFAKERRQEAARRAGRPGLFGRYEREVMRAAADAAAEVAGDALPMPLRAMSSDPAATSEAAEGAAGRGG